MNLFLTTFESVAILLGIGAIGFYIIRKKILPNLVLQSLSPLALEIALPSLIFVNIINDFSPQEYPNWWHLPLWWGFFITIAGVFTLCFMFLSKKSNRREFALSLFYQNVIFFPLAILTGMFQSNQTYIVSLFLFSLFAPAFFFSTHPLFFPDRTRKMFRVPLKKWLHPSFVMTLISMAIVFGGLANYVPNIVLSIFTLLGGMTIPLLMIILGGNLFTNPTDKVSLHITEIAKFVTIKNFIFPLLFLILLLFLKPFVSYEIALILLLQSAVPPLTAIPIVTQRLNGNWALTSQFLIASFLCSLISIPIMVSLFSIVFKNPI